MASVKEYAIDFDSDVMARGRDYFRQQAVKVDRADGASVDARVLGNEWYDVRIEYDPDDGPTYECSCPYIPEHDAPCKHCWATILQADKEGKLPDEESWEALESRRANAGQLAEGDNAEIAEPTEPEPDDEAAEAADAAVAPTSAWQKQLSKLTTAMAQPRPGAPYGRQVQPLVWPPGRRIVYMVDRPGTMEGRGLIIELAHESPKRDGTYEKPKQLKIGRDQVLQLPEEVDRQIVQMLLGARRGDHGYYGYYDAEAPRRFELPESAYRTTLRQMCETGRCRLRRDAHENDPKLLTWDDGPTWEFWLEVIPSPGGRYLVLEGSLRRTLPPVEGEENAEPRKERQTITEPDMLVQGGLVFSHGKVALLDHNDAFDLIIALRDGMKLSVPLAQRDELMKTLFALPRLPKLDLPDELQVQEAKPEPKPRLMIRKPANKTANSFGYSYDERLIGTVTFDYDGLTVKEGETAATIFTAEGRKLVHRNQPKEGQYIARLYALGFRDGWEYTSGYNSRQALRLTPSKLPKVVGELTREGWHVEAEGKLYRQPGEFKVNVASGIDWFELHGEVDFGGQTASLPKLLEALRRGENSIKLDDGTFGLLPQEWLKKYAPLVGLGEATEDHLRFTKRQVGFLDALLVQLPEARFDEQFGRVRDELMRFEGIKSIREPKEFKGDLRAYQRDGLGWMSFLRKFGFGGVLADDMGLGKAQPLDAKVLTPLGWKRMGDIVVGDEVCDARGGASRVTGVFPQGEKDIYRVTFNDGSATECCDEHLWQVNSPVRQYRGSAPQVLPLSEIRKSLIDSSGNRRHFIPMADAVHFAPQALPLEPYLLGVLLGDGGIAHRVLLSSADAELIAHAESLLPTGVTICHSGQGVDYRIRSRSRGAPNAVADRLRGMSLMGCRSEAKFVPEAYKFSPRATRLEVLRGLLDTDGHVRPTDNNIEYCTVSPRLAEDVQFLVQSLGGTARIRTKRTTGQLAYRMSIALPPNINPFRLARKANVYHPRLKYPPARAIASVEHVGRKRAQCIAVDAPDHLYITDDFIVTHNTVQVLALLENRRQLRVASGGPASRNATGNGDAHGVERIAGPSLVVAPRSLIFNWKAEAEKFTPDLRVLDHTSVTREKGSSHFENYDLVLTTYGTLRRDMGYFKDVQFDYAVLDEAQAIKNAASESAKAARLINADHRLALSGTPVQNHLGELWSLFEFLNPGMMGGASVFKTIGAGSNTADPEARQTLARALRPFILRRTKEQVAKDLPEKTEQTIFCELDTAQRKLYNELRDHYRAALLERIATVGMNKAKIMVLEALLRLRQAACHPGLIDKKRSGEGSAKLDVLMDHLTELVQEGHKVLVFSQFTTLLGIVRSRLDDSKTTYEYLDGRTKDRQARVERFQKDKDVKLFLISLKAGGLGLNLTEAEYVFLLDPWWNPAVEAQAIDRAYRIGQKNNVFAYRLIAKDTVEEKVLQLQQSKKDLADAIINADNSLIRSLKRDDLELLLS